MGSGGRDTMMALRRGIHMRVMVVAVAMATVSFGACVFNLEDVVPPTETGGGGAGSGASGAGGTTPRGQRTRIVVDTELLTGAHADFPLLVSLGPENVDYGAAGSDGADIRFYAADGATLLAHEIERWTVGGQSHVWVALPSIDGNDGVVIWMHVAEPSPPTALSGTAVWSAYAGVYHLADSLPGEVRDATVGARHGAATMMSAANVAETLFGSGYLFDGAAGPSPHLILGADDAFRVPADGVLTAEVWLQRSETADNFGYILAMEGCCLGWGLNWVPTPLMIRSRVGVTNCCSGVGTYANAQFNWPGGATDTAWHHHVAVMDRSGGLLTAYLDGVEAITTPIVASTDVGQGELRVGADFAGNDGFDGLLDEVRFSARIVPADWIVFQFATMTGAAVTVGQPENF